MKRFFALLMSLCLMLGLCACSDEPDAITPLVYEVTDADGDTVWLLGTIHVGYDYFYPLPDYVYDVYNQADALAVEADIVAFEQDMAAQTQALMPMMYQDGTTIADHIPEELYDKAVQIMTDAGYYMPMLDYYNIAMWSSLVESLMYEELELDVNLGIDRHLLEKAHKENKPVQEVESVDFQYGMLNSFSEPLQILLLEQAVASWDSLSMAKMSISSLVTPWAAGDAEGLTAILYMEDPLMTEEEKTLNDEYTKAMITDRNIGMADFAENALEKGEKVFICVGAAHVVGPGGMADLLEQRGYAVTAIGGKGAE